MHGNRTLIAALCFILSIVFAASPFLVQDFAGFDPNQFPVPQDNPPVQPAGYAFAIWGISQSLSNDWRRAGAFFSRK